MYKHTRKKKLCILLTGVEPVTFRLITSSDAPALMSYSRLRPLSKAIKLGHLVYFGDFNVVERYM